MGFQGHHHEFLKPEWGFMRCDKNEVVVRGWKKLGFGEAGNRAKKVSDVEKCVGVN